MRAIDIHAHFVPPEFIELVTSGAGPSGIAIEQRPDQMPLIAHSNGLRYPALEIFTSAGARIEQMDRDGIEGALLSIVPTLFMYEMEPGDTARASRVINDAAAAMAKPHPGRLWAMAMVPLNDPEAAAAELRRCHSELGLVGALIGPSVGSAQLDERRFDPFYAAAAELDMPLMVHPYLSMTEEGNPGLEGYHLKNAIGNPTETFTGISRMILGGVFDRHPALKVILAHGGGAFPFQLGRLDHAYQVREETSAIARHRPSNYLSQIYFDTVVFGSLARRFLVDLAGDRHLLFGTDVPFDMGDSTGLEVSREYPEPVAERILAGNATRIFGL